MVRELYHVDVVLYDQHGVALVDKPLQHVHKDPDVVEVQSGCGLVQEVQCLARVLLRELCGKLYSLALAAGEGGAGLAELEIAQADILYCLYLVQYVGHVLEELHCLVDGHVQNVRDALSVEAHLQGLAVVALAVAYLAGHGDVREEVHLYGLVAVAVAGLAPAALDVEGEAARLVSPHLRLRQLYEQRADVGEDTGVGRGVGAGSPSDGALVDGDNLVDVLYPLDGLIWHWLLKRAVEVVREDRLQRLVDERGLAASADACDQYQLSQGEVHIHVLEVVAGASFE